ncbi:MAG: VWA domain-containing protein, partial [Ginsengibacter sp.]
MKKIIVMLLSVFITIVAFRTKDITVTGSVKDENGNAIAATIKAGSTSTTGDVSGNFSITIGDNQEYLVFSIIGYVPQKIKINNRKVINVIMKRKSSAFQDSAQKELDVTGYGQNNSKRVAAPVNGLYITKIPPNSFAQNNYSKEEEHNTEEYSNIAENGFHRVTDDPLSTFSIDVDAASYSNVRRYLNNNQLPPAGAVRTEEMINYFRYQYPQPTGKDPFSINTEISNCPWNKENKLVLIGLQGKNIPTENLPPSNLVFLIDVSGSM